jgi:CubicO group peptidase (beta-lactamase class C family)
MRLSLRLSLILTLGASSLGAQQAPTQQSGGRADPRVAENPRVAQALEVVRVWLDAERAYEQIPGVSGAIVYDQSVLWSGGFGYADIAKKTPATASTIYSICSISKLFTSVGVMQLRDAGKLRLDDPVAKHLSWFNIKRTAPDGPEITVEGLLTHAAGLPRESDYPYWTGPDYPFPTHEQIVERISKQETLYPAESYFQYSNLGLTLAGEIVAAESGMPYTDYVRRNILDPLGMRSTAYMSTDLQKGSRLATGYTAIRRDGTRGPAGLFDARGINAAAGLASTAEDLSRFASWQFRLLSRGGNEILNANTLREMQRVHFVDPDWQTTYGLGFAVWRSGENTFVGHGGSCPGFKSQLLARPEEKVATVFLANALGVNPQQFAQRMYDLVGPAIRAAVKDTLAPAKPADPSLAKYVGTYDNSHGGEIAVVQWDGGLATLSLPTMDPVRSLTKLRKVGEHTFRRIRRDDTLGEPFVFEMGSDGKPTRMVWFSNYYPRVK